MKKIGVFGGTFDPIHLGHLYIAYEAKRKLGLDKILFIPSGNPPHKQLKKVTDSFYRYKMVEASIKNYEGFEVSDYEVKKHTLSYTFKTLEYLKTLYENSEIYFITGGDCLIDLETWTNVPRILELCKFVVFNRPGHSKEDFLNQKRIIENRYDKEILYLHLLNLEISSTMIRERVKENLSVEFFVPKDVNDMIKEFKLYR